MLSRGRGSGRGGGLSAKRGGRGGRGGSGGYQGYSGPPAEVIEAGTVIHDCEEQLLIKSKLSTCVPYFNGRIFLANKQEIGKVDEILGPINEYFFSVSLLDGFKAKSFAKDSMVYIDPQQTLPVSRFTSKTPSSLLGHKKRSVIKDKSFKRPGIGRGGRGGSFGLGRGNSMSFRGTMSRGRGSGFRGRGH
ncbi:putative H/ACA ribonucleoprotein complex subunit GAR1 [Babesia bovis T2Bo]|uniref:H/ACA ribonucleoprotein complex subunit n=1 Tax=Babesia bovis TaxID=5865 RepID=A7ATB2_BABBO|nr:putative H/ACA ribonucleoprotein complex subunit GAR1 [Babesia bovis T2Bo]EDO06173.1 putative H/ACA ribonucleoprotein complex subunit GAR1 [Babesia bovis T2Bo]|eukprot:XP_001609741.1 gar1 protein RNA binding region containing protein [Babesia bovis T2Bo]